MVLHVALCWSSHLLLVEHAPSLEICSRWKLKVFWRLFWYIFPGTHDFFNSHVHMAAFECLNFSESDSSLSLGSQIVPCMSLPVFLATNICKSAVSLLLSWSVAAPFLHLRSKSGKIEISPSDIHQTGKTIAYKVKSALPSSRKGTRN